MFSDRDFANISYKSEFIKEESIAELNEPAIHGSSTDFVKTRIFQEIAYSQPIALTRLNGGTLFINKNRKR